MRVEIPTFRLDLTHNVFCIKATRKTSHFTNVETYSETDAVIKLIKYVFIT